LCKHCGECGHIQRDCPAHKEETARKEYGDYFHAIIEGRNIRNNSSLDDEPERAPEIEAFMQFWEAFPSLLQLEAPSKTFTELLSSVVITKSKGDHDQVNINLTHAIHQVKCNFPNSVVGICTILPNLSILLLYLVLSNTLDLASFIVSSIFSNVAPEIEAFMQFDETFPSLLQLEAPSKTFTELLSSVVGLLSACPDHIAKYCKYDILCKDCGECGHIQRNFPAYKEETARKEYGDYFHEIIEGRNT
jgi:Zn ribbon nucleic-acid-binding protein